MKKNKSKMGNRVHTSGMPNRSSIGNHCLYDR